MDLRLSCNIVKLVLEKGMGRESSRRVQQNSVWENVLIMDTQLEVISGEEGWIGMGLI